MARDEPGAGVDMLARINYAWRLAATGGCFLTFGIGGLVLSVIIFPVIRLIPSPKKSLRARWVIHKAFGMFLWLMHTTGVLRLEISGGEKLRNCRNALVLANHPTLVDVIALVSLMPTASCVVKQALWNNPFLGGVVRAADYISNSEPEMLIQDCATDLRIGNPLLIFPEGTRSSPGQSMRFKRGAAYIALNSDVPIFPVLISCTPPTLTKHEKWYKIPERRFHLLIKVHDPITISQWVDSAAPSAIAARQLTHALEKYFTKALNIHGSITS